MPIESPHNPTPRRSLPWNLCMMVVLLCRAAFYNARAWRRFRREGFSLREYKRILAATGTLERHLGRDVGRSLAQSLIATGSIDRACAERVELLELAASLAGPPRNRTPVQLWIAMREAARKRNRAESQRTRGTDAPSEAATI